MLTKWFKTSSTVMLVHSFSQGHAGFEDYRQLLDVFDRMGEPDSVISVGKVNGIDLYFSWVIGEKKYLEN